MGRPRTAVEAKQVAAMRAKRGLMAGTSPNDLASASARHAGLSNSEQQTCDCRSRNRGAVRRPLRIGDSPRTGRARCHEPYRELALAAAAHHPSLGAQGTGRALRYAVVVMDCLFLRSRRCRRFDWSRSRLVLRRASEVSLPTTLYGYTRPASPRSKNLPESCAVNA